MKKLLIILLVFAFTAMGVASYSPVAKAADTLTAGTLVKTADSSAIYYLGDDNKLYVFPNDKTYFSWFDGFENITVISDEAFGAYELGGNVYYQPGSLLIKTPTSFKVYAIGMNGELHWIETEELAKAYYGENWNLLVDDVPEGFFTNYFVGTPITDEDQYNPDEEQEQAPTISHARGLKNKEAIKNKITVKNQKRCEYLKNSVNRLQKRAERWGLEVPTLGDDYIATCVASAVYEQDSEIADENTDPNNDTEEGKKITVCKAPKGNPANAHTISISKNAMKKHLREGYTLGACGTANNDDDDDEQEADTTAPVITPATVDPTTSAAVVRWTTNEIADSKVFFDTENTFTDAGSVSDNNDVTAHELNITGLLPNTDYFYFVVSMDVAGNEASSSVASFKTDAIDTLAPEINNVVLTKASSSAVVTWTTTEPATSKVTYSTSQDLSSPIDVTAVELVTSHSLTLSGLSPETTYYFAVESVDEQGNKTVENGAGFTTLAE